MTRRFALPLALALRATALLPLLAATHAAAVEYTERGIHRFASQSGCPLGHGTDDTSVQCNRLALDDDFVRADLFAAQRTVLFSNKPGADPKKRLAADLVVHGTARAESGQTVPVSLHVKLESAQGKWSASAHAHAPVEGKLSDVKVDLYHVSAREGDTTRLLFTPEQGLKALADPALTARLAQDLVQVRDNLAGQPRAAGTRAADVTVALGVGQVAKPVVRAKLTVEGSTSAEGMVDTLMRGNWVAEIEALSGQMPLEVIRRDLFLFGLDREPLLRPLREKGFAKGSKLVLGVKDQRGFLRLNGKEVELDSAARSGQAFLQDSFLGLVLTWQVTQP